MGLLDQFSNLTPDQSQGLLAAAAQMLQASGPSLRPTSFGQILGSGVGAFQQAQQGAQDRALQLEQAKQLALLRGLQIKEAQGGMEDHDRARQQAEALRSFYMQQRTGQAPGGQPAPAAEPAPLSSVPMQSTPGMTPPTSAAPQGQADPYSQRMALAQQLRAAGFHTEADAQEAAALKFKPKFSTDFRVALGGDGKLHNYQLADDGSQRDTGLGVRPEVTEVDLGGTKQFVDKNTVTPGRTFNKTMTFADRQAGARLAFDKSQAEGNQDAAMDPLAIRMTAQQYLAGDTSALQNFGRGAQGAVNLNAVRLEIAKQANAAGLNGADLAAKIAEFGGVKAGQRTAATRSAGIEIAANEVAQLAPLALDASSKVARSGFLPFGKAQVMFDSNTNDPNLRQFAMANTALANAYGQAMARGGVASVADKEHAKELLGTAMDQRSYAAAVSQLQQEIKAAQAAPKAVRSELSNSVTGRGEQQPAKPAEQASKFDMLPAAAQFPGKRMRADNGTIYRSDGSKWIKE